MNAVLALDLLVVDVHLDAINVVTFELDRVLLPDELEALRTVDDVVEVETHS